MVCACACVHVHVIGSTLVVLYAHAHVHVTRILSQVHDHVNSTENVQVFFAPAFAFNTSRALRVINSTEGIATHIVHTRCGPGQTDHGYTFQRTSTRQIFPSLPVWGAKRGATQLCDPRLHR